MHAESPDDTPVKTVVAPPEVESFSPEPPVELEEPSSSSSSLGQPARAPSPPPMENHSQAEPIEVEKPPQDEPADKIETETMHYEGRKQIPSEYK